VFYDQNIPSPVVIEHYNYDGIRLGNEWFGELGQTLSVKLRRFLWGGKMNVKK